jgi:hypothetical protein
MRISGQPSPIEIFIEQKELVNVQYFNYLSFNRTNNARLTSEIKSRLATAKTAFTKKNISFPSKLDLN